MWSSKVILHFSYCFLENPSVSIETKTLKETNSCSVHETGCNVASRSIVGGKQQSLQRETGNPTQQRTVLPVNYTKQSQEEQLADKMTAASP